MSRNADAGRRQKRSFAIHRDHPDLVSHFEGEARAVRRPGDRLHQAPVIALQRLSHLAGRRIQDPEPLDLLLEGLLNLLELQRPQANRYPSAKRSPAAFQANVYSVNVA